MNKMDKMAIDAIRLLSVDGVQKANSGHPGMCLGAAPLAYTLYSRHMKVNPSEPGWKDRDRFILSAGHGSMLLYSTLHVFGYDVTIDDLKEFRQWGSRTPGHPESGHTPGVDATTGPLGQGISMAVGMAMAEQHMAAMFSDEIVDHCTYALVGEGCLMEGVSSEACSLAGTLKLGKLVVLYDCNNISIEGDTSVAFSEDVFRRYEAYGWDVHYVNDGENIDDIDKAITKAKKSDKPSLIIAKTKIARHSALEGSEKTHGSPLGEENLALLRKTLGWEHEPFVIPDDVYDHCTEAMKRGVDANQLWNIKLEQYFKANSGKEEIWKQCFHEGLPLEVSAADLMQFDKDLSGRDASGIVLNRLSKLMPNMFGGSADLGSSNKSILNDETYFAPDNRAGKNIHFGVREFAMGAIANGIALHGGLRPFVATFLVFSDYLRAAVRMSALMNQSVIYVLTHDSIGVGEDGPTHEPIEHLASFRAMPNTQIFRPGDARETAAAYIAALVFNGPTLLALSRQTLKSQSGSGMDALKGGYVLSCDGNPDVILLASGSEVGLAAEAAEQLRSEGKKVRVVSMPCTSLFDKQTDEYRESVLPAACKARVVVEAGSSFGWERYAGDCGEYVCIDKFGASAPASKIFEAYGFTVENVCDKARASMEKVKSKGAGPL